MATAQRPATRKGAVGVAGATTKSSAREGLGIRRYFTADGVHPYDEVEWELRDAVIQN